MISLKQYIAIKGSRSNSMQGFARWCRGRMRVGTLGSWNDLYAQYLSQPVRK